MVPNARALVQCVVRTVRVSTYLYVRRYNGSTGALGIVRRQPTTVVYTSRMRITQQKWLKLVRLLRAVHAMTVPR